MSRELNVGKIITFSGKKVEWPLWSEKFKARANRTAEEEADSRFEIAVWARSRGLHFYSEGSGDAI